ncbi:MAG TPA: IclR family transcriptional regulator C-terminal domain-containing protein [Alphaproteobacteria bacterium]|nr:IclR family transcriptional regulator C-terminal domain-containing protein [Alphaproteobacteria bacterium]
MMSLARGLLVLSTFGESHRGLTVSQTKEITGLPRATVRRCFYTLERLGYVGSKAGIFTPRPKLHSLAAAYLTTTSLADLARPVLERLRDELGESCSVGILDDEDVFYVARCETERIVSVALKVGSRLPAYCTSMGRVLLAYLPDTDIDLYLAQAQLVKRTELTIIAPDELRKILAQVRRTGYAIVDQELELGLRSAAAPVRDRSGAVIAALNVGIPITHMRLKDLRQNVVPAVKRAAATLSQGLS